MNHNKQEIIFFKLDHEKKSITFTFIDINTKKENGKLTYKMDETFRTPSLYMGFDAYYSDKTNTYHIAITFTKYGLQADK